MKEGAFFLKGESRMNPDRKFWRRLTLSIFLALALAIAFAFLCLNLDKVGETIDTALAALRPITIGAILAYLLRPVSKKLTVFFGKHLPGALKKIASHLAIAISLLMTCLIVAVLVLLVVPQVYDSVMSLHRSLPELISALRAYIPEDQEELLELFDRYSGQINTDARSLISTYVLPNLSLVISGVQSGVNMASTRRSICRRSVLRVPSR